MHVSIYLPWPILLFIWTCKDQLWRRKNSEYSGNIIIVIMSIMIMIIIIIRIILRIMMGTCFAMVLWTSRGSPAPEPLVCSISSARVPPGGHHHHHRDDGEGEDDHHYEQDDDDHCYAQEDAKDNVKEDAFDYMRRRHMIMMISIMIKWLSLQGWKSG